MPDRHVTWFYGPAPGPDSELSELPDRFLPNFSRLGDSEYVVWTQAVLVGVDDDFGAPDLRARFEVREGVPECVEFTLRTRVDGRAIRTSDLRLFDLDGLTIQTFTRGPAIYSKPHGAEGSARQVEDSREWWTANGRVAEALGRRRGVSERELRNVAEIYLDNIDDKPTLAVMDGMGYGSMSTASRRIKQAEEAGLLPATSKGKKRRAGE